MIWTLLAWLGFLGMLGFGWVAVATLRGATGVAAVSQTTSVDEAAVVVAAGVADAGAGFEELTPCCAAAGRPTSSSTSAHDSAAPCAARWGNVMKRWVERTR